MPRKDRVTLSPVENAALQQSLFKDFNPVTERIPTIIVDNFPALGKLAAMRFLEWVQQNPEGVISLPTGKTPEHFIKWVTHIQRNWENPEMRKFLEDSGLNPAKKPEMNALRFVQIDEFYPINPKQHNSFYAYIRQFYIESFGLSRDRAMLINCEKIGLEPGESLSDVWPNHTVDLSLRYRYGKTREERRQRDMLARIDQWCQEYEEIIRGMGGIGFFLGGIGPDGHIGFNVSGSDHYSTTRLTPTNYETQASAATDLGGIEISRNRLVITIGLGTIAYNPQCVAIIIAAGEAKASVIRDAIENPPNILYPATVLQQLANARFYITRGAAKLMKERQKALIEMEDPLAPETIEKIVVDTAVNARKSITTLSPSDFREDMLGKVMLKKHSGNLKDTLQAVRDDLMTKLESGISKHSNKRFLHTEPHHDDIMLGYLPHVVRHIRDASNTHYFSCFTGGFTSVSNQFMIGQLEKLLEVLDSPEFEGLHDTGYFAKDNLNGRNRDVWQYLDGVAMKSRTIKNEGEARRLLRNLIEVYDEDDLKGIKNRISELMHYFKTEYPGKKDLPHIQSLKAMSREWEAECLWGYFGWNCDYVKHLRLGFYTGDIFTEEPTIERDVVPIVRLLEEVNPDIVTVAFDPEASGPDTHYKVLQAVTEALKKYEKSSGRSDIKVWGYRNVWYRFHPSEANIFVPVSLNMFAVMQTSFLNSFSSQKAASFPSYEHDGPFSELAQRIQVEQYQKMKICLGREWFYENASPLIRATRGLVFIKEMDLPEFYASSRELMRAVENR
ncbi:MAG: glucosamine-6-phosphate deaminase [Calditrichaeota bacterium]|nr:glucosamine-6-phosphate deaminase [Calditrichota bacterium]MCB0269662.1 glucosamine-6-phosphate deaminase [Calditrichota bacterium]